MRMYPCARGETYFVTRTIVTCELLAGCWILPPLSRFPFGKYCVAGCPSTCGIYGRSCGLVHRHHSGWQECKRLCPCPITRPVPSGQSNIFLGGMRGGFICSWGGVLWLLFLT